MGWFLDFRICRKSYFALSGASVLPGPDEFAIIIITAGVLALVLL